MKRLFTCLTLILLMFISSCVQPAKYRSQKPKTVPISIQRMKLEKPILSIETGGHQGLIKDVIFTSDERYLVSASVDKTIRVWDTSTGEIVRILRGQVGKGSEGKIQAAALAPDDRLLAVGGWMAHGFGIDDDKVGNIRLINLQTGEIKALFKGHRNVVLGLAFSPHGNRLISGSSDKDARIWDIRTHRTIHVLKGHKKRIYAVEFSPDGTLAITGSDDHTLKLWSTKSGSLIRTLKGHTDYVKTVAFTPDGKYILSGSWDKTIRLWDGRSGKFIKVIARQNRRVLKISISPDSKYVLSGIGMAGSGGNECRIFSIPFGNKITTFDKHKNIVAATDISPGGKTASTGGGAAMEIYIWDLSTGKVKQKMVGKGKRIPSVGFSKDGRYIAWGRIFKRFDLFQHGPLQRTFQIKSDSKTFELAMGRELSSDNGYHGGIESAGSWSIRTKNGKYHKTLEILKNGRLANKITRGATDGNRHSSLTLTPDGQKVISGGSGGWITSYNPQSGKKIHDFIGHTGDVWGVAVSPDSRLLVSGSDDQTVKLWEIEAGKLLLTIFQGTDNEWVAWTPEGFFDCSPGGVKYIGYHINRGEDKAADYVRIDQVYDQFYRPDLVAMKLEGRYDSEIQAELRKVNIDKILAGGAPPTVEFLSPAQGSIVKERDITLKIKLIDKGGGVGRLVYRINGVTIGTEEGNRGILLAKRKMEESIVVEKLITLAPGKNRITVMAYNAKNEIESRPVSTNLFLKDSISEKPSLYVLCIGINEYRDRALKLNYSVSDSRALANEINKTGENLFDTVNVNILIDSEATLAGIEKMFDKLSKKVKTNDVFMFFIAGHGMNLDGKYHFIPWELIYKNADSVRNNSLTQGRLQTLLAKIPALKSIVLLDTCNSGAFAKPTSRGLAEKTAMDKLMRATGRATIAGSSESQVALEGYRGHGVFTYALIQALKGNADRSGNNNGEISVNELAEYVSEEVPKITFRKWGYEQFPMQNLYGRSFPIGLVRQ